MRVIGLVFAQHRWIAINSNYATPKGFLRNPSNQE